MSCSRVEPMLVDLARGLTLDADATALVRAHLAVCAACERRLEGEREMSELLRAFAENAVREPSWNPASDAALLAAFDAGEHRRRRSWRWLLYPAAGTIAAGAAAMILLWTAPLDWPRPAQPPRAPAARPPALPTLPTVSAAVGQQPDATPIRRRGTRPPKTTSRVGPAFVPWPGAADLPAFESGQLMRVRLPASVAVALGLKPAGQAGVVQADVLIGQDGFARAVRLAP